LIVRGGNYDLHKDCIRVYIRHTNGNGFPENIATFDV